MSGVYSTNRNQEFIQDFSRKTSREESTCEIRRTWNDNIKMNLIEIECEGMDRIQLVQNNAQYRRFVNTVMNPRAS